MEASYWSRSLESDATVRADHASTTTTTTTVDRNFSAHSVLPTAVGGTVDAESIKANVRSTAKPLAVANPVRGMHTAATDCFMLLRTVLVVNRTAEASIYTICNRRHHSVNPVHFVRSSPRSVFQLIFGETASCCWPDDMEPNCASPVKLCFSFFMCIDEQKNKQTIKQSRLLLGPDLQNILRFIVRLS